MGTTGTPLYIVQEMPPRAQRTSTTRSEGLSSLVPRDTQPGLHLSFLTYIPPPLPAVPTFVFSL